MMDVRRKAGGRSLALWALSAALVFGAGGALAQNTLVIAQPVTPEGFDGDALRPGTQHVVVQTYEGLTRYPRIERNGRQYLDPSRIDGHYAESWTVSPDGKTYTFKLRAGIKSPMGNELTAADVEWGWAKSFNQKRTGAFIANVSNVSDVKAKSRYEVDFTLGAPSAILLSALTLYLPGVYDSKVMKENATAEDPWALKYTDAHTAGFGAYHLQEIRPGEQAVFAANPNYFRPKPYFDRVIWRAVPSEANRSTLLRSGQVQWVERPSMQQVVELQKDSRVKVQAATGRAIAALRMNPKFKPFDDVRVRRAMNYAVDKEAIRKGVFFGTGEVAKSIVPPIVDGYDPSFFTYDFDLNKAKQLLAEAGYANGFDGELLYAGLWPWEETMAIQVADQLKAAGLRIAAKRISDSDMRARAAPAVMDMPFFAFEDGPIVLDPVYSNYLLAHSKGVSNRGAYANAAVDAAIDAGRQELDRTKRNELMRQVQKQWMEDAPWVLTVYPETFEAMAPNIVGWVHHPDEHERWVDLRRQ